MSALLTPRRPRPSRLSRPEPAARQESLFGALPAAAPASPSVPTPPARTETDTPAAPARIEPTAPESAAPAAPARAEPAAPARVEPATPTDVEPELEPAATTEPSHTARAHRQGPTLDDLVAGAWEGLLAGAPAACPVCESTLTPRFAAGPGVVGGRCGGCGSTLG